jgi:hypothetical protein
MPKSTRKQEAAEKKKKAGGKRDIMKDRPEKEPRKKIQKHDLIADICSDVNITDPILRSELYERHAGHRSLRGPLEKKKRNELELLTHIYYDMRMGHPPATDLKDFLNKYMSQNPEMIGVTTYIKGGSSAPDVLEADIMPIKAYEFLQLVKPYMEDVDICDNLNYGDLEWHSQVVMTNPTCDKTIPDKKWLAKQRDDDISDAVDGFWHNWLEGQEDWDVYYYFLDHYDAANRDGQTVARWKMKHPRPSWAKGF